jgi:hypothetical protein
LQPVAVDRGRTYSATEFDGDGNPVKRVDLAGRMGDSLPHEHRYNSTTNSFGDKQPLFTEPNDTEM